VGGGGVGGVVVVGQCVSPENQITLWEKYRREIEANRSKIDLVVFSSEHFSYFLEHEAARVKELMDSLFDEVSIVLYLRRQPEYLVSRYYQHVTTGAPLHIFDYLTMPEDRSVLAYHQLVKRWSIFGKDKIKIRVFDTQEFRDNDLLSDFAHTVGFEKAGLKHVENQRETAMDSASVEFQRLLNVHIPALLDPWTPNPLSAKLRSRIASYSQNDRGKGKKEKAYHFNRSEAQRIIEQFKESNDWIAREYLGREKLFSEDVSMYPEVVASPHNLTLDKCAEITAALGNDWYQQTGMSWKRRLPYRMMTWLTRIKRRIAQLIGR
jgi:hypothetical protein